MHHNWLTPFLWCVFTWLTAALAGQGLQFSCSSQENLYLAPEKRMELEQAKRATQDQDVAKKDLSELTKGPSNPLSTVRGVVLRNANAANRDAEACLIPGSSNREMPDEGGVSKVEATFPDSMRPSEVMKRFKLFKWATGKPPSGEVKEDASGGLYTGTVGVSAKNRMGHVGDMRYVAHRGGSGMVNGLMRVAYEDVYAATAEAMKWGALGKVDYGDDAVGMVVKMEPQCFEGFAVALEEVCRSPFSFESQLNPPLFVADIGGGRARSSSGARRRQSAKEHWEHDAEAEALTAEQPWLKEGGEMPADGDESKPQSRRRQHRGLAREATDEQLLKEQERLSMRETQAQINEEFRELAKLGKASKLEGLKKRGWQVHVDRSPSYLRVDAGHQTKRMHHINKQRQEEATKNRVIDMWVPAGGSAQRVYPDIHSKDEDGNTALILAARNGWSEAVDVLLNMGASTRAKNNRGLTALAAAKLESSSASLAVFSGASGAAGRKRRAAQCCLLLDNRSILKTCQDGDLRRARYLLAEKGENVNSTNKYGMTPLHFAIMAKDVELTQLLVAFGANTHAVNNNGQSPVSLISGIADEKLAGELQDALGAGEAAAKQRRRDIQRRAAQLEAIAKEEDLLAREMRTYTKGTAAAAAVFKSFQKRHKGAKAAYRADTKEAEAAWPLPDPDKVKRPPGRYRLSGDAKRAMDWDPTVPRNALSLTSAWNRHALSLFHKQMKSKASREYKAKVTAAKAATELHRTQTTMAGGKAAREALRASKIPPYWAGSEEARHQAIIAGKTYTGAASTSSLVPAGGVGEMGGAQAEFIARSANPVELDKELRDEHHIPQRSDPQFEAWLRMRFGSVD